MRHVLVTGGAGQLGIELQRAPWPDDWIVEATDVAGLDLRDTQAIVAKVLEKPWAAVVNAGAFTAVDAAEHEVVTAWAVNALAPAAFAQACAATDIPLIQISTDYVFNGKKEGRWDETTDPPR